MRLALITGGLFLLSYIAVNRGLGDNPLEIITSILVVVGFVSGLRWLMQRGRAESHGLKQSQAAAELLKSVNQFSPPPSAPTPGRSSGAKKLF